jgi:hypothetical protein
MTEIFWRFNLFQSLEKIVAVLNPQVDLDSSLQALAERFFLSLLLLIFSFFIFAFFFSIFAFFVLYTLFSPPFSPKISQTQGEGNIKCGLR